MPDEATQAPDEVQETPTDAAPDEGNAAPESPQDSQPAVDYQQRYESLVPEYTRGQQLIAAARGDHGPEAQVQALQQLGVDVQQAEEEAEADEFEDPTDRLAREVAAVKQQLTSKEEAEQQKQFQELERKFIDNTIGDLESKEDLKLTDKEKRFVKNDALNNRLEDGRPDLESAFKEVVAYRKETLAGHVASKKASRAPVGTAGSKAIDPLKDPEAYKQQMAEEFAANRAAAEGS